MRSLVVLLLSTLSLLGCASNAPEQIAINQRQQIVMDPAVLSAGIVAEHPEIAHTSSGKRATVELNNTQPHPVTLHYRFYWYDSRGLDVLPFEETRTLIIPPNEQAIVVSSDVHFNGQHVRLYLFL